MPSIVIKLRNMGCSGWQLFGPKGNEIGPRFRGKKYDVLERARSFVSTWYNWTVVLDEGDQDEKTDRVPG